MGPITSPGAAFVTPPSVFRPGRLRLRRGGVLHLRHGERATRTPRRSAPTACGRRPRRRQRRLQDAHPRLPADVAEASSTARCRRVAERDAAALDAAPDWTFAAHRAHARGLRLGRRVGAVRRRGGRPAGRSASACRSRRSTRRATARSSIPATASRTTCSRRPAQALRHPSGPAPLGDLEPKRADRGRRVAVGVPHGHLRQRRSTRSRRSTTASCPQPRRRRRAAVAGAAAGDPRAARRRSSATTSTCRCSSSRPRPT